MQMKLGKKWEKERVHTLRYEARLKVLDGKLAMAKALNKLADKKEAKERKLSKV